MMNSAHNKVREERKSNKRKASRVMSIIYSTIFFPYGIYRLCKNISPHEGTEIKQTPTFSKTKLPERKLTLTREVYQQISCSLGAIPSEQGGMLGSSDGGKTIDHFYWDIKADTTCVTYSPNIELINKKILPEWNKKGVRLVGVVHSHPKGSISPSGGDAVYAEKLLTALNEERFYLPIVQSGCNGHFKIYGYAAEAKESGLSEILHYELSVQGLTKIKNKSLINKAAMRFHPYQPQKQTEIRDASICVSPRKNGVAFHSRVEEVYPLEVMRRKTVIVAGCGGAGEYIENIARTGVGRLILFDGDTYSETNIATQSVYRDEIGKNKAKALKNRVAMIDPDIKVIAIPRFLDDAITDEIFEKYVGKLLKGSPKDILMTACTDSFPAQARCAKLALKYGMPFMAAQLYERGQASEIIFTYPGVTPACPRCMLASRYDAYFKEGYKNEVGSHQTPIFATQRTNALKGYVSLMLLLYHEVDNNPFNDLLDVVKNRNFINIRMSAEFDSPIFKRELGNSPYTFFDEALWMTQVPDNGKNGTPICPDCHGFGDLRMNIRQIADTRKI